MDCWQTIFWTKFNSMGPRDAVWCYRTWWILVQVIMTCCLTVPSHYQNQGCIISEVLHGIHLKAICQQMLKISILDINSFKIRARPLKGQRLNQVIWHPIYGTITSSQQICQNILWRDWNQGKEKRNLQFQGQWMKAFEQSSQMVRSFFALRGIFTFS